MTREELEKVIQHFKSLRIIQRESFMRKGFDVAIKALEQESVIDKLRAEIENHCGLAKENHCKYCSYCNNLMGVREILEIIDKYRAESEEDNGNDNH